MLGKVLVIGAGIIGSAIADRLQSSGCEVFIFEADIPAGGCTGAGMGHLLVLDESPAQLALSARGVALWRKEDLTPSCEREARGTLRVGYDDEDLEEARATVANYSKHGLRAEVLDPVQLREAEPALRPGLAGGLLVPDDQVIYPIGGARFLLERALRHGATLVRSRVCALQPGGLRTDVESYQGDAVILAAGVGTTDLLPSLPITPRRGQLAITERVPGLIRHHLGELGYVKSVYGGETTSVSLALQPRATGQLLIGSCREFVGMDPTPNRPLLSRMLRKSADLVPALAQVPVLRTWAGFRPCGPAHLPFIGPWPNSPGLFVATGHEGLGITTSLVTAELIAHHVLGTPAGVDPHPFLPMVLEAAHA